MTDTEKRMAVEFALANITGKGFSGDLGYASPQRLAEESEIPLADVVVILDNMHRNYEVLRNEAGFYSGLPVDCMLCDYDPCICGIGLWR